MAHLAYCKKCYESGHITIVKPKQKYCFECENYLLKQELETNKKLLGESLKVVNFIIKQDEQQDSKNYVYCTEICFAESVKRARDFLAKLSKE